MRHSIESLDTPGPRWHNREEKEAWQKEYEGNNSHFIGETQVKLALLVYQETHPGIKIDNLGHLIEPDREKNHDIHAQAINEFAKANNEGVSLAGALRAYAEQMKPEMPSNLIERQVLLANVKRFAADTQQRNRAPRKTIGDIEDLGVFN